MQSGVLHGLEKESERMSEIVIDIPAETYKRLEQQARRASKDPEAFTRELVKSALVDWEETQPQTVREVLVALGRTHPLSETLRRKIIQRSLRRLLPLWPTNRPGRRRASCGLQNRPAGGTIRTVGR